MTILEPEPGLAISYSFLWSDEAAEGHAEGRKQRPCAIVLATAPDARVPDGKRVVVDEVNVFVWPGFDLRHLPGKPGQYAYGYLPPRFFDRLRDKLRERRAHGRLKAISRD